MRLRVDVNRDGFERMRTAIKALQLTEGDFRGPILTVAGQVHRKQEARIFASEGGEGGGGAWTRLSSGYEKTKRAAFAGGRAGRLRRRVRRPGGGQELRPIPARREGPISMKILVWSGDMRDRFLSASRREYIEEYVPRGAARGVMRFGAASTIAGYHFQGGASLPRRDPVSKTATQVGEILESILLWYRDKRVPQVAAAIREHGTNRNI